MEAACSQTGERHQKQKSQSGGEDGGKEVNEFQCAGVKSREVDACDARVVNLFEELLEVRSALVPHPRLGEEPATVTGFKDAGGEVNVLAETHWGEASEFGIDGAAHAHVEGTGIELVQFFLAAADAAGGEEGGHGIVYRLLRRGEVGVCAVRSAEGIAGSSGEFALHSSQIVRREHHVGVKHKDVVARGSLHSEIAGHARSGVLFEKVSDRKFFAKSLANIFAAQVGTVLHNEYFKVLETLMSETLQQFLRFIGAVKDGNDKRIFHKRKRVGVSRRQRSMVKSR